MRFLLVLFLLGALPAGATTCQDALGESVNPNIVRFVRHNDFIVDRSLSEYKALLAPQFWEKLIQLSRSGHQGHWADFGAGELLAARAVRSQDLIATPEAPKIHVSDVESLLPFTLDQRPRVTAFSAVIPRGVPSKQELEAKQIRLIEGFFENIQAEDIEEFDLGTDLHGIFAYTNRLSEALQKALSRMKKDGLFVIFAGAINERHLSDAEATYVELENGTHLSLRDWFFRIEGLKVNLAANDQNDHFSVLLQKTNDTIRIPLLEPIPLKADSKTAQGKYLFSEGKVRHFKETGRFLVVPLSSP